MVCNYLQVWMILRPFLAGPQHPMVKIHFKQLIWKVGHRLSMDTSVWIWRPGMDTQRNCQVCAWFWCSWFYISLFWLAGFMPLQKYSYIYLTVRSVLEAQGGYLILWTIPRFNYIFIMGRESLLVSMLNITLTRHLSSCGWTIHCSKSSMLPEN